MPLSDLFSSDQVASPVEPLEDEAERRNIRA